jgi:hypothetical protein
MHVNVSDRRRKVGRRKFSAENALYRKGILKKRLRELLCKLDRILAFRNRRRRFIEVRSAVSVSWMEVLKMSARSSPWQK